MKTLLLTVYTPKLDTGHGLRTYGIVAALARWGEVEVAYRPLDGPEPAPEYARLPGVKLTRLRDSRGPRRAAAYLGARRRGVYDRFARGITPELVDAALAADAQTQVVADGPTVAAALLGVAKRRPVIYCAHNLESGFRGTTGESGDVKALRRFERDVLAAAHESWMVSSADVAGAHELCPSARVRLVPNVIDVRAIEPVAPEPGSRRVIFVGDLTYAPNQAALAFLRDEVWPALRELVPDAEIVVGGRNGNPEDGDGGSFRVIGYVEDLPALYRSAAAVAVPLLQGGGSPLKFVEALAYGLPVVATPKAAAGLDVTAGEHYLEGADGPAFAQQLARVLTEGAREIGHQARRLALERYSIEALEEALRP